jgi:hypothetical protein
VHGESAQDLIVTKLMRSRLKYKIFNIIHLLTGYEGNSTFIVPKVPTIFEATPRKIFVTEGTIKVLLPEYQVYKCFIILNNCAILNSKLGPFLMNF